MTPVPRAGLPGLLDRMVGPGAPRGKWILNLVPACLAATLAPIYAYFMGVPWSVFAYVVAALLLALFVLPQPEGLEWFLPLFYLKLLVSHLSAA